MLKRDKLFGSIPEAALERAIQSFVMVKYEPAEVVMREGEIGEFFLFLTSGTMCVLALGDSSQVEFTATPGCGLGAQSL